MSYARFLKDQVDAAEAREREKDERIAALEARIVELEASRRSVMCAYCGEAFFEYPSTTPRDTDHESALAAFAEHDSRCRENPLVARIATLEARIRELTEWRPVETAPFETRVRVLHKDGRVSVDWRWNPKRPHLWDSCARDIVGWLPTGGPIPSTEGGTQ